MISLRMLTCINCANVFKFNLYAMLGMMMGLVYDSPSFFDGRCPSLVNIALSGLEALSPSPEGAKFTTTG